MPQRKRHKLKRKMAQAHNNLDRALEDIQAVHSEFESVHDDYTEYLETIAKGMIVLQGMIKSFWENAWGKVPDDLTSYRG